MKNVSVGVNNFEKSSIICTFSDCWFDSTINELTYMSDTDFCPDGKFPWTKNPALQNENSLESAKS